MVLTCTICSTKLTVPDKKVPKEGVFTVSCPKCQQRIKVHPHRDETDGQVKSRGTAAVAAPEDDDFVENRRLAMVCLDQLDDLVTAKTAVAELGYTVHMVSDPVEAWERLRQHRYELVVLHEEYGAAGGDNIVLKRLQLMPMATRRDICVGLIGRQFRTLDHMAAYVHSVNFVVADRELGKLKAIAREALAETKQFYRVFQELLRETGRQ